MPQTQYIRTSQRKNKGIPPPRFDNSEDRSSKMPVERSPPTVPGAERISLLDFDDNPTQEPLPGSSDASVPPTQESLPGSANARVPPTQESLLGSSNARVPPNQESLLGSSNIRVPPNQEPLLGSSNVRVPPSQEPLLASSNGRAPNNQESMPGSSNARIPPNQSESQANDLQQMDDMRNEFNKQIKAMQDLLTLTNQSMQNISSHLAKEIETAHNAVQVPSFSNNIFPTSQQFQPTSFQQQPPSSQSSTIHSSAQQPSHVTRQLKPPSSSQYHSNQSMYIQRDYQQLAPHPTLPSHQSQNRFVHPSSQSSPRQQITSQWLQHPPRPTDHFTVPPTSHESIQTVNELGWRTMTRQKKIYPLPIFTGAPEEWPTFSEAFYSTTMEFEYSPLHNIMRLRDAIQRDARQVVEALLTSSNNVEAIMMTLEDMFGRPEQLIGSQVEKVRAVAPVIDGDLPSLVNFANKIANMTTFLQNSHGGHHLSNPTLLSELVSKLPTSRRMQWAEKCLQFERPPTIVDFSQWLVTLRKLANMVSDSLPSSSNAVLNNNTSRRQPTPSTNASRGRRFAYLSVAQVKCPICNNSCSKISECKSFLRMSVDERWKKVKELKTCFCCLKTGHQANRCFARKRCGLEGCSYKHHRLLHTSHDSTTQRHASSTNHPVQEPAPSQLQLPLPTTQQERRNCHAENIHDGGKDILFQILPVKVYGHDKVIITYAFVDDGANVTMVDQDLARELGVRGKSDSLELQWLNKKTIRQQTEIIEMTISGVEENSEKYQLSNVYTTSSMSLPTQSFNSGELLGNNKNIHLSGLPLIEYTDIQPKLILSLAHAFLTVPLERPYAPLGRGPIATRTRLGWIVYGPVLASESSKGISKRVAHINKKHENSESKLDEMNNMMKDYFDMETFGIRSDVKTVLSKADERSMLLLETKTKDLGTRYEAGLLWKEDLTAFPDSYNLALKRLENVERKMVREPEYAKRYLEKIEDYVKKGYARKLSPEEDRIRTPRTFYLPHFGVINPNKEGIRLVFDAAAEVKQFSLNKALLTGPDINQPLTSILFKFRQARYAVCGDIKEMFHQIQMVKEDQDSQRFLWREDSSKPPDTYVMERLIFGATCSPTIAQYVKNINALKYVKECPRAVVGIIERHYVDDYVDCFQTEEEAMEVLADVLRIHRAAGFELRNIATNSDRLKSAVGRTLSKDGNSVSMDDNLERILGMYWLPKPDVFVYTLKFNKVPSEILNFTRKPTKREMLSMNMSVFDPFGFLVNFMITAKVLMQFVWKAGIQWDESLPENIYRRWKMWIEELPKVKELQVPRCYFSSFETAQVDLHVFVDASEEAMAAVAYWRATFEGKIKVVFVAAKSSLAPTRFHTIPKLELQAAVMGVRLMESIVKCHTVKINRRQFWTDSHTVIRWIRSDHRVYKQYVANRVSEILECSQVEEWGWCPGVQNPADEATRAKFPMRWESNGRWMKGPQFLYENEDAWPDESLMGLKDDRSHEEIRTKHYLLLANQKANLINNIIKRFSNYSRLKRSIAWLFRYMGNLKKKVLRQGLVGGELEAEEEAFAEEQLSKWVQQQVFTEEYSALSRNEAISQSSTIKTLNPFISQDGVVRVNGRITNAGCLSIQARQPVILPTKHDLTALIVRFYHIKFHHINTATAISELRRKFWIPSVRRLMNMERIKCEDCKIRRAKPVQPQMSALPMDRVTPYVRPFSYTGLDYFGPITVTIRRQREKRWVALFTCLTVRAVHLEIATDLSTDACIICIRNFINRRGVPQVIRSDNGTNFVGIAKELQGERKFMDQDTIKASLTPLGIKWKFNTPLNPSEGGAWERLVQSVKRALYLMLKEQSPRLDTLQSFLIEAENMVNSRPLTHIPVTPQEPEPLTPNHFLLGYTNTTQTPAPYEPRLMCLRKQWRVAQNLKNGMWHQWIREYLPELTRRTKWCLPTIPVNEGSLVFICDPEMPRSQWKRARVIKLFYGTDGVARSAVVRTSTGELRRPISKLAVLDVIMNEDGEASPSRSAHGGGDVIEQAKPLEPTRL